MKKCSLLFALSFLMLLGYGQKKLSFPADSVSADGNKSFHGLRIDDYGALPISLVAQTAQEKQSLQGIKLTGTIDEVCQAKGCWMTLRMDDGESIRVKFKDYGFFVPTDAGGKKAVVRGDLAIERVPVEELRHYAVDGGMSEEEAKKKYTQPEETFTFLADGVIIIGE